MKLFKEVHNFVHLNLAIALFVGYFALAFGTQLATSNKVYYGRPGYCSNVLSGVCLVSNEFS